MSPKVLLRCDICGKFHAAYLVEEHGQKRRYCLNCWKGRQAAQDRIAAVGSGDEAKSAGEAAAGANSAGVAAPFEYDPNGPWNNDSSDK